MTIHGTIYGLARRLAIGMLLTLCLCPGRAAAASRALLVVGLGGDLTHARRYAEAGTTLAGTLQGGGYAQGLLYLHEDGGIPPEVADAVRAAQRLPDGSAAKTNLLAALAEAAGSDGPDDTLLLFLVGHADARISGSEGMAGVAWNFHLPGPDLSLNELETALRPYRGRVLLVVATPFAGTVTRLAGPRCAVLAVARGDEKFPLAEPECMVQAVAALTGGDTPATFANLARELQSQTAAWYRNNDFIRSEHQNLSGDAAVQRLPLYGAARAWQLRPEKTVTAEPDADPLASDLDLLALMRLARDGDTAAPAGTEAVIRLRALDLTVDEQGMTTERRREIIHILAPRARDRADVAFTYSPPDESWELLHALVISADTVQEVVPREIVEVPVAVPGELQEEPGLALQAAKQVQIYLPGMRPGVIADVAYVRRVRTFSVALAPGMELLLGDQDPVRQLNLRVTAPKRLRLRVATRRLPELVTREGRYGRSWRLTVRDLPAFAPEPLMPPPSDCLPRLLINAEKNWNEISRWYARLTEATRAADTAVNAWADRAIDTADPVRGLYDRVAHDIRYVAIPLGVHGYKPHLPAETLRRGYGDCKDKATLLIAALAGRGITAHIALIGAGGGELIAEVPRESAFNHAIVAIPTPGAAEPFLFLDPTAEVAPYGTLPETDEGREVLVVLGDTGMIVRTPISPPESNRIDITRTARLTAQGLAVAETRTLTGLAACQYRLAGRQGGPEAMKQALTAQLTQRFAGAALTGWRDANADSVTAPYLLFLDYLVPAPAGMIPVPFGSCDPHLPPPPRVLPLRLPSTLLVTETTVIAGVSASGLPDDDEVENRLGSTSISYEVSNAPDGTAIVTVRRRLRLAQRDCAAAEYPEFYELLAPAPVFLGGPAGGGGAWWWVVLAGVFGAVSIIGLAAVIIRRQRSGR